MRHATPNFAHIFAGDGYSSGYYSYMWSEVMDADGFEAFEQAGVDLASSAGQAVFKAFLCTIGQDFYGLPAVTDTFTLEKAKS